MSHFDTCRLTLIWLAHIKLLAADWQSWPVKARFHFIFIFMLVSVTYYISLYVGEKRLAFHLSPRDGHVITVSGCLILIRMAYKVFSSPRSNVTFNISLHEVYVRVSVRYVITKFSRMDSLPNFLTDGALRARELRYQRYLLHYFFLSWARWGQQILFSGGLFKINGVVACVLRSVSIVKLPLTLLSIPQQWFSICMSTVYTSVLKTERFLYNHNFFWHILLTLRLQLLKDKIARNRSVIVKK